jgi:hypothetical protein
MTNYFVRYLLLLLPTILISCKDGFDKELEREAKEFTTNRCPIEVESGTTLDSLTYDPNRRIYKRHIIHLTERMSRFTVAMLPYSIKCFCSV